MPLLQCPVEQPCYLPFQSLALCRRSTVQIKGTRRVAVIHSHEGLVQCRQVAIKLLAFMKENVYFFLSLKTYGECLRKVCQF